MANALIFTLATVSGIAYWVLGLLASSHFENTDTSGSDRFLSSGMLWSLALNRYNDQGKKLCRTGNIALIISVALWITWAVLRK